MDQSELDRIASNFDEMVNRIIRTMVVVDTCRDPSDASPHGPPSAPASKSPAERIEADTEHWMRFDRIELSRARLVAALRRPWDEL